MHYLVGTDSVHTTAAICDYLERRATPDDAVTVVAVVSPNDSTARRDGQEALNVASVRLTGVGTVETELREAEDEPATALLEVVDERGVDSLVVGPRRGTPSATGDVGSTAIELLARATVPVVVVSLPEP